MTFDDTIERSRRLAAHDKRHRTRQAVAQRLADRGDTMALYALRQLSPSELEVLVRLEQEGGRSCPT